MTTTAGREPTGPDRLPVIVGVGRVTRRPTDQASTTEPAVLLAEAVGAAVADARLSAGLLDQVDTLEVVNLVSWSYDDPAGAVAERFGLVAARRGYGPVGGEQPVRVLAEVARRIAAGEVGVAVIAGGEAMASRQTWGRLGRRPPWGERGNPPFPIQPLAGLGLGAAAHGLIDPVSVYPLWDNAHRHASGASLDESLERSGRIWSAMSTVAARTSGAWMPEPRSAGDIVTPSRRNRRVAFPYTKLMCAQPTVDQAAAVVMTSVGRARALGIPESTWVYPWADAGAVDRSEILRRSSYSGSAPLHRVLDDVLDACGLEPAQVDLLELYSCFPIVPILGLEALGYDLAGPLPNTTAAGGLTFFGGPLSAYMLCAATAVVDALRAGAARTALLHGNGEYLTKQHALVLGASPPPGGRFVADRPGARQATLDAADVGDVTAAPEGPARVETWTALYDRDGAPWRGIVVGRLGDGARFVATTPADTDTLGALTGPVDLVGARGRVTTTSRGNRFELTV